MNLVTYYQRYLASWRAIYEDYQIIIGGDYNVDFKISSFNLILLNNFIEDEGLISSNIFNDVQNDFTYESGMGNKSFIDHFLFSSNIRDEILKCNIVIDRLMTSSL